MSAKADKPKRKVGRPSIVWSDDLVTDICDHLSTGKSVIDIGNLQGYPSSDSMYRQMATDPDFAARIAHARQAGQDHEADAIVHMADCATNEDWQVVKLRMAARQWRAAKLAPKRYGEKVTQEHTGDGGGPILYADLSDDELDSRIARLAAQA